LEKHGFKNIEWHGTSGNDRGRDIVCIRSSEPLPGVIRTERWLVQCKRYTEKRISKGELNQLLAAAREHKPDTLLLVITDTLNSSLRDWLAEAQKDFPFSVVVWEELHLRREVMKHRRELLDVVPEILKSDTPTVFYQMKESGCAFVCNDFEEIEIRHINESDPKKAKEIIREFILHLQQNKVLFDSGKHPTKIIPEDEEEG
jgi:hypothetical protein